MVLVTSRMGLGSAAPMRLPAPGGTPQGAPLLPKVRGQFAEFLDQGSLVRLGFFGLPTGVGVRYGQYVAPQAAFRACPGLRGLPHRSRGAARTRFSAVRPTSLNGPRLPTPAPAQDQPGSSLGTGAGISTSCPSPTPRGLGLGPTHPLRSARAVEPLGFRRWGFSPHLTLLIPTFALVSAPHWLTLMLHGANDAPLPLVTTSHQSRASVHGLAPLHCRRSAPRPVSYYALFQGWLLLSQPPGCLGRVTSFATEP